MESFLHQFFTINALGNLRKKNQFQQNRILENSNLTNFLSDSTGYIFSNNIHVQRLRAKKINTQIREITTHPLELIASSEAEKEIESRVIDVLRRQSAELEPATGVEPSLTDDELKAYLKEVLEETGKQS